MQLSKIIRKGKLIFENGEEFNLQCGNIEENNGVYFIETFYKEDNNIWNYFTPEDQIYFYKEFKIVGQDEELHDIEITSLQVKSISYNQHYYIKFRCNGHLKHNTGGTITTEETYDKKNNLISKKIIENSVLWYIEIENFIIKLDILADKELHYNSYSPKNISLKEIHIAKALFEIKFNKVELEFRKSNINNNIIICFNKITKEDKRITEKEYFKFKNDFISFISFLNGGRVNIRREYLGNSGTWGKIISSKIISYSFKKNENSASFDYIPIKYNNQTSKVLDNYFKCFNSFIQKNYNFDFSSIIFILNGNNDTKSLDNRFFSLIIAFERLSHKYSLMNKTQDKQIISNEIYDIFKNDLISVLDKNKSKFKTEYKNAYSALKSKLTELNLIKRNDTKNKFYHLLNYANILITPEIEDIINNVRNTTVHQGYFGDDKKAFKNYLVIDKLIRDIILKIISYKGQINENLYL